MSDDFNIVEQCFFKMATIPSHYFAIDGEFYFKVRDVLDLFKSLGVDTENIIRDCESLPSAEEEIYKNGYNNGFADAIDECIKIVARETHDGALCDYLEELKEQHNV